MTAETMLCVSRATEAGDTLIKDAIDSLRHVTEKVLSASCDAMHQIHAVGVMSLRGGKLHCVQLTGSSGSEWHSLAALGGARQPWTLSHQAQVVQHTTQHQDVPGVVCVHLLKPLEGWR